MTEIRSVKRLETGKSKQAYRWLLSAVLGLLVCLSFYAFLTVLTVLASAAFDLTFWVRPRLFFESFQGNASLLFASLSVYIGFAFFLFLSRNMRLKTKQYTLRSRKRLGSTEFQGRAWGVLYIMLALCLFSFVGFAFEDFHLPMATDPFFAIFIQVLAGFIFLDILFTFYRLVISRRWPTLLMGGGIVLLGLTMLHFSGGTWSRGKAVVEQHRELFNTEMDLPIVSFNSNGKNGSIWRAEASLILDSAGTVRAFSNYDEIPMNHLYTFFDRHHIRMRAEMKVYADKDLPLSYLYELDRKTACLDGRVFHYITQLEGAATQKEWWENYSSHYISMKLRPTECYTIRLPPLPPAPEFGIMDTLFVGREYAVYKETQLTDEGLEELLRSKINPEDVVAVYYTPDCTYGRYLQTVGMVFETAYDLRDAYSLKEFDSLYEDLTGYDDRRIVKERYPLRMLDLSRMEYHAERDTAEFEELR